MSKRKLIVCTKGKACRHLGGKELYAELKRQIQANKLQDAIKLKKADCLGLCKCAPVIKVKKPKMLLGHLRLEDCALIVRSLADGSIKRDASVDWLRLRKH